MLRNSLTQRHYECACCILSVATRAAVLDTSSWIWVTITRSAFTSSVHVVFPALRFHARILRIAKVCTRENSGGERSGRITHTFCHSAPWCIVSAVWRRPSVNTAVCDFSCQLLICECVFVFTSGCEEKIPHRLFSRIKGYSPTLISCATGSLLMCLRFTGLFRRDDRFCRYGLLCVCETSLRWMRSPAWDLKPWWKTSTWISPPCC